MKPFTTTESLPGGKTRFLANFEGAPRVRFTAMLSGESVVAYCVPSGQSLEGAWFLQLFLGSEFVVEITASSTRAENWQEFGTVNVVVMEQGRQTQLDGPKVEVMPFQIEDVTLLLYEDENHLVESGLALRGRQLEDVLIVAGEYPGSITVKAPFAGSGFEPQFPIASYKFLPL